MLMKRVLAFSSSKVNNTAYLENAVPVIKDFLGDKPLHIAFIPFADADNNYDGYLAKVRKGLEELPYSFEVVKHEGAGSVIEQADAILVGGGNTFKLLHHLYHYQLADLIRDQINAGKPYVGWSAGSNIAGLSIGTTNDMPIIEPRSFKAFGFFPFQINSHYINLKTEGHNGETRDERLYEYLKVNQKASIVGLPEGAALQLEGGILKLMGQVPAVLFQLDPANFNLLRTTISIGQDLSRLL
jgi:dipeptidase E